MGFWIFRDRSQDHLTFKEQWEIVKAGYKKGVKYDGCTASPDLDFGADCCGEHDAHYQLGDISRYDADNKLYKCLRLKGYFVLPVIYWLFVRVGAWSTWNKYRGMKNEDVNDRSRSDTA